MATRKTSTRKTSTSKADAIKDADAIQADAIQAADAIKMDVNAIAARVYTDAASRGVLVAEINRRGKEYASQADADAIKAMNESLKLAAVKRSSVSSAFDFVTASQPGAAYQFRQGKNGNEVKLVALTARDFIAADAIQADALALKRLNDALAAFVTWAVENGIAPITDADAAASQADALAPYPRSKSVKLLYEMRDAIDGGRRRLASVTFRREHFAALAFSRVSQVKAMNRHKVRPITDAEILDIIRARVRLFVDAENALNAF